MKAGIGSNSATAPALDEALARLAALRLQRERHEAELWCLDRAADELRCQIRMLNKASVPATAPMEASP